MKNFRTVRYFGFSVLLLSAWSALAVGPVVCDYSRCYQARDGMVICPEGACKEVPPVKGKP